MFWAYCLFSFLALSEFYSFLLFWRIYSFMLYCGFEYEHLLITICLMIVYYWLENNYGMVILIQFALYCLELANVILSYVHICIAYGHMPFRLAYRLVLWFPLAFKLDYDLDLWDYWYTIFEMIALEWHDVFMTWCFMRFMLFWWYLA